MDNQLIEKIDSAVRNERTVTFTYEGEVRTVKAERLSTSAKSSKYLTGYDTNRCGTRRFSVEEIVDFTEL